MSSTDRTPAERTLHARLAAHESWAHTPDRAARTAKARAAALDRFERQVDPDGTLAPQERAKRAESARKAHFTRLALLSAQARRRRGPVRSQDERDRRLQGVHLDLRGGCAAVARRLVGAAPHPPWMPHCAGRSRQLREVHHRSRMGR